MHSLAVIGPGKVLAGANHQEFSSLPVRDRLVNASLSCALPELSVQKQRDRSSGALRRHVRRCFGIPVTLNIGERT
jgi:hypothetical protein